MKKTNKSKRVLAMVLALVISLTSIPNLLTFATETTVLSASENFLKVGSQTQISKTANFRNEPSIYSSVINTLLVGTKCEILDVSNKNWTKIKLEDGKTGYVYSTYLKSVETDDNTTDKDDSTVDKDDSTADKDEPILGYLTVRVQSDSYLNMRAEPSGSGNVIKHLYAGTVLTNYGLVNGSWYKVADSTGLVGYAAAPYLEEYNPSSSNGTITISASNIALEKYKSVYLQATSTDSNTLIKWVSSDESIATVVDGYVYAKGNGTATITAKDAVGTSAATCKITVTDAEDIRFAYTNTNAPSAGETFNFTAITSVEESEVTFEIIGKSQSFKTTTYTEETQSTQGFEDNTVRIFTAEATLEAGKYTIQAYTDNKEKFKEFTIIVTDANSDVYSSETRSASSDIINIIGDFEGFSPVIYPDQLAYGIPTLGYGVVIYKNNRFYNNLTKTEGYAQLVDTVNNGGYTGSVNSLIKREKLLVSQKEFDAMVSFTYNVGNSWTYDSTPLMAMKNTVNYNEAFKDDATQAGTVSQEIAVYSDHSQSSSVVKTLAQGTSLTATGYWRNNFNGELWYSVTSSSFNGTAWVRAGYVSLTNYAKSQKNLEYIDALSLSYGLLLWQSAGGVSLPGLVTRRLCEAKIFLYAEYEQAYHGHPDRNKNTYNFIFP